MCELGLVSKAASPQAIDGQIKSDELSESTNGVRPFFSRPCIK